MACGECKGPKCKGECLDKAKHWTWKLARPVMECLERVAIGYGAHVGMTGGVLYHKGPRKDLDVVVYRHGGRQLPLDRTGFIAHLAACDAWTLVKTEGRVVKALCDGRQVDFLFHDCPEAAEGMDPAGGS